MNRNRVFQINIAVVLVQEANPALAGPIAFVVLKEHLFSLEQAATLLDIMTYAFERDRREAHGVASGESGSQPEDDPTGRELIDGSNGVSGHRSDTIARDGDASP